MSGRVAGDGMAAGRLHAGIDASSPLFNVGGSGGIATALVELVRALGGLDEDSARYTVIVGSERQREWLQGAVGPNTTLVMKAKGGPSWTTVPGLLKRALGPMLPTARRIQRFINIERKWPEVRLSDGFYERLGCEVLHFPTQDFVLCAVRSVYSPHDLQHLHYPEFWSPTVIAEREIVYRAGCHFARTVVVGSQWAKDDVVREYGVSPRKVQVILEGPPTESCSAPSEESLSRIRSTYRLEREFGVYPAVTWPHKNHLGLLEALAHLRDSAGIVVHLVCTGSRDHLEFWRVIERRVQELRLESQVRFLGFVPTEDLRGIYRVAQFLVMPTLFEASSLPIFEAWFEGLPVACSDATALPEQVMDAALLFDGSRPEAIAEAIGRLATDSELRGELRKRGQHRVKAFNWERTAKCYRAVYRRVAGRALTEEDRWLLESEATQGFHREGGCEP